MSAASQKRMARKAGVFKQAASSQPEEVKAFEEPQPKKEEKQL
jgi:hypothetical protein